MRVLYDIWKQNPEDSDIIVQNNSLYLVTNEEKFIKVSKKLREDTSKVFSIFHSTISPTIYELIRNCDSAFDAFNILKENFKLNTYVEQQNLRNKIRKIYFTKLNKYINDFEILLAEYTAIGGNKLDTSIYDSLFKELNKLNMQFIIIYILVIT